MITTIPPHPAALLFFLFNVPPIYLSHLSSHLLALHRYQSHQSSLYKIIPATPAQIRSPPIISPPRCLRFFRPQAAVNGVLRPWLSEPPPPFARPPIVSPPPGIRCHSDCPTLTAYEQIPLEILSARIPPVFNMSLFLRFVSRDLGEPGVCVQWRFYK